MTNYKKLKNLFNRLEKKEKELLSCRSKIVKLEQEVEQIKKEINKELNATKTEKIDVDKMTAF